MKNASFLVEKFPFVKSLKFTFHKIEVWNGKLTFFTVMSLLERYGIESLM